MIAVERPQLLDAEGVHLVERAGIARQVLLDSFARGGKPEIDDTLYRAYKAYLFAAFDHKCAYCETLISAAQPGDVEHYRPKNRVTDALLKPIKAYYDGRGEVDHLGYFWLAYEWDNLLFSCTDCNRYRRHPDGKGYGKADRFPVDGIRACCPGEEAQETALLLDPTRDDPNAHFIFHSDGTIQGRTRAGETTIELLGLNTREHLVRERRWRYAAAWRALGDYITSARDGTDARIEQLRQEVNEIWEGKIAYSAFGRLAIEDVRARYARLGWQMPFPLMGPDGLSV